MKSSINPIRKDSIAMDDKSIIELFWKRDEKAIEETDAKYGKYIYTVSYNILRNKEDTEECRNDTYLDTWHSIPPAFPSVFSAFLAAIARRISIDMLRHRTAAKRGGGETEISINELDECIPSEKSISDEIENEIIAKKISDFLSSLPAEECDVFMRRYWYFDTIDEICTAYGFSKSKVKTMLMRTRRKLRSHLEQEGIFV